MSLDRSSTCATIASPMRGKLRSIERAYVRIVVRARAARRPACRSRRACAALAPALDRLPAVERHEMREARGERLGSREKVRVLVLQQRDAQRLRRLDAHARRCAHRAEQRVGQLHVADLPALRFDEHRTRAGSKRFERREQLAFEPLLRRLRMRRAGRRAASRDAARCASRSSTCAPSAGERVEQAALAGAGEAADHDDSESVCGSVASASTTCRRYAR